MIKFKFYTSLKHVKRLLCSIIILVHGTSCTGSLADMQGMKKGDNNNTCLIVSEGVSSIDSESEGKNEEVSSESAVSILSRLSCFSFFRSNTKSKGISMVNNSDVYIYVNNTDTTANSNVWHADRSESRIISDGNGFPHILII